MQISCSAAIQFPENSGPLFKSVTERVIVGANFIQLNTLTQWFDSIAARKYQIFQINVLVKPPQISISTSHDSIHQWSLIICNLFVLCNNGPLADDEDIQGPVASPWLNMFTLVCSVFWKNIYLYFIQLPDTEISQIIMVHSHRKQEKHSPHRQYYGGWKITGARPLAVTILT